MTDLDNAVLRALKASGIRVKPLEWEESLRDRWIGTPVTKLGDLAVALMVERAAERLEANRVQLNFAAILGLLRDAPLPEAIVTALSGWLDAIAEAIRALAPASALAELQALRDERDVAIDSATQQDALRKATLATMRSISAENEDLRTELATLRAQVERLTGLIQWAHDTLWELNPGNYGHDDVCKVNDAAVEVILGLAPIIGETHGHSVEWWEARAEAAEAELVTLRAQVERLTGALTIAANRLHRCSVDYDTGTREFIEVGGWADEARAALTEGAAP